jgi:hypothetical protein
MGEALVTLGAVGTLGALLWKGTIDSMGELLAFAIGLLLIAGFYFALLLAHAVYIFMTGADKFWWEKYEDEEKKKKLT